MIKTLLTLLFFVPTLLFGASIPFSGLQPDQFGSNVGTGKVWLKTGVLTTNAVLRGSTNLDVFTIDTYAYIRVSYMGDSIVSQPLPVWPSYITNYDSNLAKAAYATNYGVNGGRASGDVTLYSTTAYFNRPRRSIDEGWFFYQGGGNDIVDGVSAATTYGYLTNLWGAARTNNYKVVAMTVLPRTSWGSGSSAIVLALNNLILSNPTLYDYVVRADLVLNDPANTNWFYDGTHPTVLGAHMIAKTVNTVLTTRPWILSPSWAGGITNAYKADLILNPYGGNVGIGTSPSFGTNGPLDRLTISGDNTSINTLSFSVGYNSGLRNIRGVFLHGGNSEGILNSGGLQIAAQAATLGPNGSGNITFFTTPVASGNNNTDAVYVKQMRINYDGIITMETNLTVKGIVTATNGVASYSSNLLAAVTITIGASPTSFTNTLNKNIQVFYDGVSVTGTLAINGTVIFNTIGQNTAILQPGEYSTVTYTIGTPTAKWKPF